MSFDYGSWEPFIGRWYRFVIPSGPIPSGVPEQPHGAIKFLGATPHGMLVSFKAMENGFAPDIDGPYKLMSWEAFSRFIWYGWPGDVQKGGTAG